MSSRKISFMESEPASTHHKVRLVRCPKCRMLLPESADIPVYKCGGCGTVLQVKNQKKDAKSTASAQLSELNHVFEVGVCSSSSQNAIHCSLGKHSLDKNNGRDEKISRDCSTENSGDLNASDSDQNNGRGESSSSSEKAVLYSSGECSLHQDNGSNKRISSDSSTKNSGDVNSLDGDQNNESDRNESQDCNIKQPGVSIEFCSPTGDACHNNEELSQFAEADSKVELTDTISLLARAKLAVDDNSGSDSTLRSSNNDTLPQMENNSTVASHRPAAESISLDAFISSTDERPKQLQSSVNHRYERRDSFSPRSDISSKTEYFKSKSPTFRSSHEYDGSVSSFDGTDDAVPHQHINLYRSTYKVMNSVISEEWPGRGKFLENSIVNGNSRLQHQARNLSSTLPDKRPYTSYYRKWNGDELVGSTAHGLTVSRETRLRDEKFPPLLPFYQRGYSASYESGSTSSQLQDEFHHRSSEHEKIKLLRLVYELQDRINKRCHANEKAHRKGSPGVADFLIFKRRFHQLRCGACSKVLKFSLEKGNHIVPYIPEAVAPSTNQLNDNNRRNSVSSSRGNDCSPVDPMSCSDDYGPSYCRSCSTDGDPVILAAIPSFRRERDTRNMSYSSSESIKETVCSGTIGK